MLLDSRDRAEHLEGKLRQAVAEIGERHPLEHHVGDAAIGRRLAVLGEDQAVLKLRLVAAIDAEGVARLVERLAVSPDATDPGDLALAKRHGEVGEVAVFCRRDLRPAALPALLLGLRHLLELRRPDDLAGEPGAPIDARDRRTLGRGLHVEVGEARSLDLPARAEERLVERIARQRPGRAPKDRAGRPKGRTKRAPGDAENERCHVRDFGEVDVGDW